jgi:hypothetical protein
MTERVGIGDRRAGPITDRLRAIWRYRFGRARESSRRRSVARKGRHMIGIHHPRLSGYCDTHGMYPCRQAALPSHDQAAFQQAHPKPDAMARSRRMWPLRPRRRSIGSLLLDPITASLVIPDAPKALMGTVPE